MQRLAGNRWPLIDIKQCELKILEVLNFALKSLTAYDFVCAFLYHFECENELCFDEAHFYGTLTRVEEILDQAYTGTLCEYSAKKFGRI